METTRFELEFGFVFSFSTLGTRADHAGHQKVLPRQTEQHQRVLHHNETLFEPV